MTTFSMARSRYAPVALLVAAALPWLATSSARTEEIPVRLNTLGYAPADAKRASVVAPAGAPFKILRTGDAMPAYEGTLGPAERNADTDELLAVADFTPLAIPGDYQLQLAGLPPSAPFRIAPDLYRDPFRTVMRGMYLWRCGTAVSTDHNGETFAHAACHRADGYLDYVGGGHERRPGIGGWHDAGDYNKYVVNSGVTVGALFRAWQDFQEQIEQVELGLPKADGALPEFLAELKWQLDWLLTMQADDGSVYHKLSTTAFGGMILPEQETADRYFTPWGSNATADFAAMMALAARHFAPYDAPYAERCLTAARKSYAFLAAHPESHRADQDGFSTGGYDSNDWDDRLWADAELWETTGDPAPLAAFEQRLRSPSPSEPGRPRPGRPRRARDSNRPHVPATIDPDFDWANIKNLALLTYLESNREGRDPALVEQIRASLVAAADSIVATTAEHGYARPLGTRYYWGCNGSVARQAIVLEAARRLTDDPAYCAVQRDALNHLFGRNPYGRSFVTGLGAEPPLHPHDRRSAADSVANPWPGYLVGGAHPGALDWRDDEDDYRTNEIAINWNAALIYALAAQLEKR